MNVEPPPKKPIHPSEEKDIFQEVASEDQFIEVVVGIDSIFGDRPLILEDFE